MRASLVAILVGMTLFACVRERVDVADSAGESDASVSPEPDLVFAGVDGDGGADADASLACSAAPPIIGRCSLVSLKLCPNGYVLGEDGRSTCDCCP